MTKNHVNYITSGYNGDIYPIGPMSRDELHDRIVHINRVSNPFGKVYHSGVL